jgi:hypothetical protein
MSVTSVAAFVSFVVVVVVVEEAAADVCECVCTLNAAILRMFFSFCSMINLFGFFSCRSEDLVDLVDLVGLSVCLSVCGFVDVDFSFGTSSACAGMECVKKRIERAGEDGCVD